MVVVDLVLLQDRPQMSLVPEVGSVRQLATASHVQWWSRSCGRPDVAGHGVDPGVGEDRAERGSEVRSAVTDLEPGPLLPFPAASRECAGGERLGAGQVRGPGAAAPSSPRPGRGR